MNYKEKLKSVETLEQLIDLREELLIDEEKFSSVGKSDINFDNLGKCQRVNFWLKMINQRIDFLVREGEHLDKIEKPKTVS